MDVVTMGSREVRVLYGMIMMVIFSCLPGSNISTIWEQSNEDEYQAYIGFYSKLSRPLQNLSRNDIFLLARAAELSVKEYNKQQHTEFRLRFIKGADFRNQSSVIHYHLYLEQQGGNYYEGYFETRVALSSNLTVMSSLVVGAVKEDLLDNTCDTLSKEAGCTKCSFLGRCARGHVPIVPWLDFALRTQQEIQIDEEFPQVQMPAAHNAFNSRADGYGVLDDCPWPPPYDRECVGLANQEFSLTDMLNMGVRALEIDPWWCFDEMRMSHALDRAVGCSPLDKLFADGMREVGEWVHSPQNAGQVLRLYFEDGSEHTEGHDDLINGPIEKYLGDLVFTPADRKALGRWPTPREMRQMNKTVLLSTDFSTNHGGVFIHDGYWTEYIRNDFTPYPDCGRSAANVLRYYCDSTNYGPFWNGPKETGVILNFTEFMKCGIQYPAADQVTPTLLESAVWTWAKGQPSPPLTLQSCVFLNGTDHRWYSTSPCNRPLPHACIKPSSGQWVLGTSGNYGQSDACPHGYQFSLPVNGLKQQQLIAVSGRQSVWINMTNYLPLLT